MIFPTKLASNEREATSAPQMATADAFLPCCNGVIELTWTTRTVDGLPFSQRQSLDMIESTRRPKTLPRQNFICSVLSWHVICPVQQYNLSTSVRRCAGCLRILGKINQTILSSQKHCQTWASLQYIFLDFFLPRSTQNDLPR